MDRIAGGGCQPPDRPGPSATAGDSWRCDPAARHAHLPGGGRQRPRRRGRADDNRLALPPPPGSAGAIRPNVPCRRDLGPWHVPPWQGWTDCDRGPRKTRRNGPDPCTAQSRSARSGEGSSRHVLPGHPALQPVPGSNGAPAAGSSRAAAKPTAERDRRSAGRRTKNRRSVWPLLQARCERCPLR